MPNQGRSMRSNKSRPTPLPLDLLFGAAAGALGSWLMSPAMSGLAKLQPDRDKEAERHASLEEDATVHAAQAIARPLHVELDQAQKQKAGTAVHFGYGTVWGIGYALLARRYDTKPVLSGLALGTALWALGDEIMVPMFGWAPKAQQLPASAHGKALGAHLAYGAVVDTTLRLLHAAAGPVLRGEKRRRELQELAAN